MELSISCHGCSSLILLQPILLQLTLLINMLPEVAFQQLPTQPSQVIGSHVALKQTCGAAAQECCWYQKLPKIHSRSSAVTKAADATTAFIKYTASSPRSSPTLLLLSLTSMCCHRRILSAAALSSTPAACTAPPVAVCNLHHHYTPGTA